MDEVVGEVEVRMLCGLNPLSDLHSITNFIVDGSRHLDVV